MLTSMIDIINSSPKPVSTIGVGKAMSCGAVLIAAGTKGLRYAAPLTDIMVHEISSGTFGKMNDIQTSTENLHRLNDTIFMLLDKYSGGKKGAIRNKMMANGNADWYLTPKEYKKMGLIDHVKLPILKEK